MTTVTREALVGKLVLVLSRATPEELAAVERILEGHAFPGRQAGNRPAPQRGNQCRFALQKGQGAWAGSVPAGHLVYEPPDGVVWAPGFTG